jgi:mono/diheme cytochrome c family protein
MKQLLLIALLILFLAACGAQGDGTGPGTSDQGIMERHQAQIPAEYAGLTNPIPADEPSLERGAKLYATNCASCHGDGGMGDGPVGAALDPAPAPVAQTSQMMADDYLFWRVSEGGAPFNTSMPPWKFMEERDRWDILNYMCALGDESAQPSSGAGAVSFDPTAQVAHQTVDQDIIIQTEADISNTVHTAVEQYRAEHPEVLNSLSSSINQCHLQRMCSPYCSGESSTLSSCWSLLSIDDL